jgi:hypothetical protein
MNRCSVVGVEPAEVVNAEPTPAARGTELTRYEPPATPHDRALDFNETLPG